jgi:hypothetical protein
LALESCDLGNVEDRIIAAPDDQSGRLALTQESLKSSHRHFAAQVRFVART